MSKKTVVVRRIIRSLAAVNMYHSAHVMTDFMIIMYI